MQYQIARVAAHTGNLLRTLVEEEMRGQNIRDRNAVVCYGAGYGGTLPALNAHCSQGNKLDQAHRLHAALQDNAIRPYSRDELRGFGPGWRFLGRAAEHTKGRDIKLVLEAWQVAVTKADFFTPYIPSRSEFRTWIYRNRHLGTYEKVLTRPEAYTKIGRNYANGFDFSYREEVPDALKNVCRRGIAALGLDFGAVDTLEDMDGNFIVLEVNSAPGVQNERRRVIQALAHRVVRWVANDCPGRRAGNGD